MRLLIIDKKNRRLVFDSEVLDIGPWPVAVEQEPRITVREYAVKILLNELEYLHLSKPEEKLAKLALRLHFDV